MFYWTIRVPKFPQNQVDVLIAQFNETLKTQFKHSRFVATFAVQSQDPNTPTLAIILHFLFR